LERLHLAADRAQRPEQVHASDRAPLDRGGGQHRLVGAAVGLGDLADPHGDPVHHLPAPDHECRHQLGAEGLMTFLDRMADLAESWWEATATATPPTAPAPGHRELMRQVAAAVALRVVRPEVGGADPSRLVVAEEVAARLAALQGADGLFSSDGNLHSPPDSAFAINDLGATIAVIDAADDPALAPLRRRLLEIGERALPALLAGGVHTPNHRWEIASALVRLRALDERAVQRAEQWLAEGVDVDADGLYSERSANYAAFVSNPSLLVLAEALVRPDLVEVVHRNLHAQLVLTDADGVVETVFSRRQDQDGAIPLSAF